MLLREKGKKDAPAVGMGWDEAQAALSAGTHEVAEGGGADATIGGPEAPEPDLDAMTRAELEALAAERGVDVSKAGNKAEVIAALKATQA